MFMKEDRVRLVASQFMPKLKKESVDAMVDVASNGLSVLASATKQGLSHQALSKNLVKLEQLQHKIVNTASKLSSRSEEHTSELQSHHDLVCRLLLEKKKKKKNKQPIQPTT